MNRHTYGHLIFDKRAANIQDGCGKKIDFSTNGAGSSGGQHAEEYKLIHSYPLVLSSSPRTKNLHIKPDTLKLIEKKLGK